MWRKRASGFTIKTKSGRGIGDLCFLMGGTGYVCVHVRKEVQEWGIWGGGGSSSGSVTVV